MASHITSRTLSANGLQQHLLERPGGMTKLLLIHGNGSSSAFWRDLMSRLPNDFHAVAPDLRGYGLTEAQPADARKSYGDFVADLAALADALGWDRFQVMGHSLGGGICWELMTTLPQRLSGVTLVCPASPFGFGGCHGETGQLNSPDGAGSGGGLANPEFVKALQAKDRGTENPFSGKNVMNQFYWMPPFVPENLEELLDGLLQMQIGDRFYPGDAKASAHFPFAAPGDWGQLNAASPISKGHILSELTRIEAKPPVCWIRGSHDLIVSDHSLFDAATLGAQGLIPHYPGEDVCPPQPMVAQTRFALNQYQENGGYFEEILMHNTGHSPFIEQPDTFLAHWLKWLNGLKDQRS